MHTVELSASRPLLPWEEAGVQQPEIEAGMEWPLCFEQVGGPWYLQEMWGSMREKLRHSDSFLKLDTYPCVAAWKPF